MSATNGRLGSDSSSSGRSGSRGTATNNDDDDGEVTYGTGSGVNSPPAVVETKEAVFESQVARAVNESIFPRKQFIIREKELDVAGNLAKVALQALNMEPDAWCDIKEKVRRRLNIRRNNAQQSVRNALHRKS